VEGYFPTLPSGSQTYSLTGHQFWFQPLFVSGNVSTGEVSAQKINSAQILTYTNCAISSAPAPCAASPAGTVQIAAAASTLTVDTTIVTVNSEIFYSYTTAAAGCSVAPTNMASLLHPYTSSITPSASFTVTLPVAPVGNPACVQYHIIN
jgi:hypothetical protein